MGKRQARNRLVHDLAEAIHDFSFSSDTLKRRTRCLGHLGSACMTSNQLWPKPFPLFLGMKITKPCRWQSAVDRKRFTERVDLSLAQISSFQLNQNSRE